MNQDGQVAARLCDFGFAKHVPSVEPGDLEGDPTTCYQSPERWQACHSASAAQARVKMAKPSVTGEEYGDRDNSDSDNGDASDGGAGCGVTRRDETAQGLFASDVFSAGVTLFVLVSYHAILARLVKEARCRDVGEAEACSLPALNVFQHAAGGDMFGLLQAKRSGGTQGRLWAYW